VLNVKIWLLKVFTESLVKPRNSTHQCSRQWKCFYIEKFNSWWAP